MIINSIILVMDDTPSVRSMVGKLVSKLGFDIAAAGDGKHGLSAGLPNLTEHATASVRCIQEHLDAMRQRMERSHVKADRLLNGLRGSQDPA
ncbi:MAG: hypothetical protein HQM00_01000 [Magnetococcales bacterium]|nr:hypothetical protein [Magnetococcales bacterium]